MADNFTPMAGEQLNIEQSEFEKKFAQQQEELEKQREEYYKEKAERLGTTVEALKEKRAKAKDSHITIYTAKAAANNYKSQRVVEESFIHRTIRLIKGFINVRKQIKSYDSPLTHEKKKALYHDVYVDAWAPVAEVFGSMGDKLWDFVVNVWEDFVDIILFFVNVFITISYYIGSLGLFLWDVLWDIRIWLDARKRTVFQYFAVSVALLASVLIFISSLTAYEYSYYGRTLGVTRTKQEVYQTIEALGDKLSQAAGANVSIDVERDIEFKKVFGFKLGVDSAEDILNTLTYMRDIQVRAYAVKINGTQTVILESEEVANNVIQSIRDDFVGEKEGVEYTQIVYEQSLDIEEVGVLLGEIWNPEDAVRYIETGSSRELAEGEKANPLITINSVEHATYQQQVKYGSRYVESSEIYEGETELISAGTYGINEIVAEITRVNGVEQKKIVKSNTRIKNPVDAVYYKGTKPIPEKKGTGEFLWPIRNVTKKMLTSYFGSRNTGIVGATTNHLGLDIGVPTGTKIYACDGGKVTFAGWQSGYGYVVIIDHGGLYETRYGHCSKILVKVGEDVYQGQNIALVGSTGVSSGPHCHLEIRYNGDAKNPINYLPKL
ncbi:MAG: peptidoglycan DD-metalloendopeptidase family protein [Clostridia bacterium]|nr:peptidoglycan DD-metalloendopeptidase family protein [Clostridia bacterium]